MPLHFFPLFLFLEYPTCFQSVFLLAAFPDSGPGGSSNILPIVPSTVYNHPLEPSGDLMKFPRYWAPTSCGVLPSPISTNSCKSTTSQTLLLPSCHVQGKWGSERRVIQIVRGGTKTWTQICVTPKLMLVLLSELDFPSPGPVNSALPASLSKDSPASFTSFKVGNLLFPEASCSISGFLWSYTKISLPVTPPTTLVLPSRVTLVKTVFSATRLPLLQADGPSIFKSSSDSEENENY